MNEKNRELLEQVIQAELETLSGMEVGSEPYKIAVDGLTKLIDRATNLKKMEEDASDKVKQRIWDNSTRETENNLRKELANAELALKREQMEIEKSERKFSNGIAIASIVVPSMITIWGTFKTLKFEEQGTVTTIMGRGFINKLLPKK